MPLAPSRFYYIKIIVISQNLGCENIKTTLKAYFLEKGIFNKILSINSKNFNKSFPPGKFKNGKAIQEIK